MIKKIAFISIILFSTMLFTLPPNAEALPPRPEPTSTPAPRTDPGAGIELSVSGAKSPCYAIVQWQDGLGGWHNVETWRGQVENNRVIWYVTPELFGKGPFRWVVYRGEKTLVLSESFNMPTAANQLLRVVVVVKE